MNFRSEFTPKPFRIKIKHTDKLLLVGSCFTEQIGKKLAAHKFDVLENPNGILFNPISIAKAIKSYVKEKLYTEEELFNYNELWASREHHTRFSDIDKAFTIKKINDEQQAAVDFIKNADWILLTLGSAFVYEWKDLGAEEDYKNVAANCHKIPTDKFNRRLLEVTEIINQLQKMQHTVLSINPSAKFIYTISPVRHLREGFIENNRSKAALINAVHTLTNDYDTFYFPAYELVIDDLRDYRFFAEDLVHPNYSATNYVWEKFLPAVIDEHSQILMKEINEINAAMSHKPFNENSSAHNTFKIKYLEKVNALQEKYRHLNMEEEIIYFTKKPLL
ncbi:MAG: GSCFA domain-containing protein [Ferruginibacter sp.]|nr:GSCFA domain-containing protein [Ferruginibacter sp.]